MLCLGRKAKRSRISEEISKMFVSESSIFPNSQALKLSVISWEGGEWNVDISPDFLVEKLKLMALGHFLNPLEGIKLAPHYKLLLVSERRVLREENTVLQENVKHNDELLLLLKRKAPPALVDPHEERDQLSKGPSEGTIVEMTNSVMPQNVSRPNVDANMAVVFQTELRKILISLVDASQKILCKNPDVLPIFKAMQEKVVDTKMSDIDPNALKQLTEMGFTPSRAAKALRLNKMSPVEAMEWLLEQDDADDADSESSTSETRSSSTPEYGATDGDAIKSAVTNPLDSAASSPSPSKQIPDSGRLYTVAEILETFKAFKRKGFRPNLRALVNLKEMGFSEEEVIDALRINNNNQDAACEWLLGDRHPTPQDMDKGLDPEGPIYKAIISNPVVQLGLNNPKTFLAFLHMLENPNTANHWLNDPDTAPLLSQIFRIYHAEKHSLQMQPSSLSQT